MTIQTKERAMQLLKRLDRTVVLVGALALVLAATPAGAQVFVQCPGDLDGDAIPDPPASNLNPEVKCTHLSSGDGFAMTADGEPTYIFSFADLTGQVSAPTGPDFDPFAQGAALRRGMLAAEWPAPTVELDEGDEWYLTLTNVGMMIRPDLFDPHTVHFHGHPNMAPVFDGLPESGLSINMGASLSYYYKIVEPGTYMYHCHVEATEHMQMGMLGNLYVNPAQNGTPLGVCAGGAPCTQFVYNDGDGSTGYDVAYPIQLGSFDKEFHDASWNVQPLPFADMKDEYFMINGRGYPDTINVSEAYCSVGGSVYCGGRLGTNFCKNFKIALPPPLGNIQLDLGECVASLAPPTDGVDRLNGGKPTQRIDSRIVATQGERVLLRISNLNVTTFNTLTSPWLPMQVVGRDAKLLRSPAGGDIYRTTNSVTLGGGMSMDVILDTAGVAPGTYFLYSNNLYQLNNQLCDPTDLDCFQYDNFQGGLGGMLTEIVIQ
jgi:FtsP/CotA-like multicopper oxidase with cupredoxin domain